MTEREKKIYKSKTDGETAEVTAKREREIKEPIAAAQGRQRLIFSSTSFLFLSFKHCLTRYGVAPCHYGYSLILLVLGGGTHGVISERGGRDTITADDLHVRHCRGGFKGRASRFNYLLSRHLERSQLKEMTLSAPK